MCRDEFSRRIKSCSSRNRESASGFRGGTLISEMRGSKTWMSSSHLNGGRNGEIESRRPIKSRGHAWFPRCRDFSPPHFPIPKFADEVRCYYIEDYRVAAAARNGLTSLTKSSPSLEASSTLIRIADMLRGVDPSRSHPDRILSCRLPSKVDDASWILISVIRKSFLDRDHHSLARRLVILLVLIHGFHKKPHCQSPSENELIFRAGAPCVTIGV